MVRTPAAKHSAMAAWDTLKMLHMQNERMREWAQVRRREFEELHFCDGESIEDFALRLTAIVNDLQFLNHPMTEYRDVLKFLHALPRKYQPMAMAIESFVGLQTLMIEKFCRRLQSVEESNDLYDVDHVVGDMQLAV